MSEVVKPDGGNEGFSMRDAFKGGEEKKEAPAVDQSEKNLEALRRENESLKGLVGRAEEVAKELEIKMLIFEALNNDLTLKVRQLTNINDDLANNVRRLEIAKGGY